MREFCSGVLRRGALWLAVLGAGCEPPSIPSEGGLLEFYDDALASSTAGRGLQAGDALLVGTPVCPEVGRVTASDTDAPSDTDAAADADTDAPVEPTPTDTGEDCPPGELTGATWDGDCFAADAPGPIVWLFHQGECVDPLPTDDEFLLRAVAAQDVSARVDFWAEDVAEEVQLVATGDADPPALPGPHSTVNVLADTPTGFDVRLDATNPDDSTTPTAFRVADAAWSTSGAATAEPTEDGYARVDVPAGSEGTLTMAVAGAEFDVGAFRGVSPDDVDRLSLVAWTGTPETLMGPIAARALGVTADGEAVFGLDAVWSVVRGEAAISEDLYADQPGYVWVSDACVLPTERGGPRELTLRARWRTFTATAELVWEGVAGTAEDDAEFEPDPNCQGGCGCTSAPAPSGAGALLGLAAAITARRRRRTA